MRRARNLLDGLPAEARSKRDRPDDPVWAVETELLAQLVEEVSVLAADYRRPKPREIPRPAAPASTRERRRTHGGLLSAAMSSGRVRHV